MIAPPTSPDKEGMWHWATPQAQAVLATAARWAGKGLTVARHLDNPRLHTYALRMHGNELRKSGLLGAAASRVQKAQMDT